MVKRQIFSILQQLRLKLLSVVVFSFGIYVNNLGGTL